MIPADCSALRTPTIRIPQYSHIVKLTLHFYAHTLPHIVVKDGTVTRLLDAAEIAYVEVRQHDLLYNLCGGDGKTEIIKNRGSMQEIAEQLTPYGFVRCSASYLVNLRCITAVSRMNVYIGGAALPIGRTYKDAFTEAFSRYMAKKEWEDP